MFKASSLLFLHAESGLHAGSGQSLGAIDLAIQRERYTNYPMIAASGVKGALRDWFSKNPERDDARLTAAFGPDTANASDHAGAVATTDARLLLFPVRSARGVFAWTTAPTALARLRRDLAMAGGPDLPALNALTDENVVFGSPECILHDDHGVLLEEFAFRFEPKAEVRALADWLAEHAVPRNDEYGFWRSRLPKQLLILPDDAFRDFVTHATEVQARVKLGPKKTTSEGGSLFYQENLPADSLLYAAVLATDDLSGKLNGRGRAEDLLAFVRRLDGQRIQLGGDETVGKGICCARFLR